MITRRIAQRMFLLRPEKTVNAIFEYCLAEAAMRYGVVPIAWTVMSNHYHAIVHDPLGKLPAFLEQLHKMVAKCLNAHHGRWENVWSTEETCCTRLVTPDDVIDKVVYVLTNPVAAHLVDNAAQWPGATSWPLMGRGAVTRHRPEVFFKKKRSKMPETVELRASVPPSLEGPAAVNWMNRVRRRVAAREAELAKKRRREGIPLLGLKNVLATKPIGAPRTETRHRKLRPALACRDKALMTAARDELRAFWRSYWEVLNQFRGGARDARFPAGTYRMRTLGACCSAFPKRKAA
jgi:REP element-mobilizing transposase RayT